VLAIIGYIVVTAMNAFNGKGHFRSPVVPKPLDRFSKKWHDKKREVKDVTRIQIWRSFGAKGTWVKKLPTGPITAINCSTDASLLELFGVWSGL